MRAVCVHRLDEAFGERADRFAVLRRALNDLVIDVRDVAHVRELVAAMAQIAAHDIEDDHHACMADMQEVVDGHATHVHADPARRDGLQLLLLARQ